MDALWLNSPAEIIAQALVDLGLGVFPTTSLSSGTWVVVDGNEPDSPDECITVYDTTGIVDGHVQVTGETSEHCGIQIRIRGRTGNSAFVKASAISLALDKQILRTIVTISAVSYCVQAFTRTTPVIYIGKDSPKTNRMLYTFNGITKITART